MSNFKKVVEKFIDGRSCAMVTASDGKEISLYFHERAGHYGKRWQYYQPLLKYIEMVYKKNTYYIEVVKESMYLSLWLDYGHKNIYSGADGFEPKRVFKYLGKDKRLNTILKEMDNRKARKIKEYIFYANELPEVKHPDDIFF